MSTSSLGSLFNINIVTNSSLFPVCKSVCAVQFAQDQQQKAEINWGGSKKEIIYFIALIKNKMNLRKAIQEISWHRKIMYFSKHSSFAYFHSRGLVMIPILHIMVFNFGDMARILTVLTRLQYKKLHVILQQLHMFPQGSSDILNCWQLRI